LQFVSMLDECLSPKRDDMGLNAEHSSALEPIRHDDSELLPTVLPKQQRATPIMM
jgi:hypothetical protein